MADIELVIKMSEEKYDAIKSKYNTFPAEMKEWGLEAINNGTPLPKGHGRLINADDLKRIGRYTHSNIDIDNAPTIIKADTESEDKENDI